MANVANVYTVAYPTAAFAGVRTRRLGAWAVDVVIVAIITGLIGFALALMTLGLSLFALPPLYPVIAILYYAMTVSGSRRATFGMRAFDLEVVMHDTGGRAPFLNAAAQALLFWVSWCLPIVFVVTLFDSEKRFFHDILSALVVVRRPN